MVKRLVKRNGDEIFPLGIGAMRLPTKNNSIDRESAQEFILYAIENGVNYIDTAYAYHGGESESFLGDILSLSGSDGVKYRDKIKLSTKLPSWMVRSREDMDAFLNEQLRKLQTDFIDYYYVHSVDLSTILRLKDLGLYEFLEKAMMISLGIWCLSNTIIWMSMHRQEFVEFNMHMKMTLQYLLWNL